MKFFTQAAAVIALSGLIAATPVMANASVVAADSNNAVEVTQIDNDSLEFAFDDAQNVQAKSLSDKEMEDTEGAWG